MTLLEVVNTEVVCRVGRSTRATVDLDATILEAHKRNALFHLTTARKAFAALPPAVEDRLKETVEWAEVEFVPGDWPRKEEHSLQDCLEPMPPGTGCVFSHTMF